MAYIQTEITAEAVIAAMNEDSSFAHDMWMEIAQGIHKGLLLDNTLDLLRVIDINECVHISNMLKMIPDFIADHIDHEIHMESE